MNIFKIGGRPLRSIQLAGIWHKSSFSESGGCVEVRMLADVVQVRNTRDRGGAVLNFTFDEWRAFLAGVFSGEFSLPQNEPISH